MIILTNKQKEYCHNANARWNIKTGAVRSGKSFVDVANVIPERIITRRGESGLAVILGVSRDTIERNVLKPMREIYTPKRVSSISSKNTAVLFGEEVYCLGAEKVSQVAKIQGASIKYCYGDEIAKWNKDVFEMLKSRLDKPNSCFDGALNPENPGHWFKAFLDSDLDIYRQVYTIFDNPYLPPDFVKQLCKEYEGTVFYNRLILGEWKRAEGAIYRLFADDPAAFYDEVDRNKLTEINIGVDFGGNMSGHSFVATGYEGTYETLWGLSSIRHMHKDFKQGIDPGLLNELVIEFINDVQGKYGAVDNLYWDNAETTLGTGIKKAVDEAFPKIAVWPAAKKKINNRINATVRLMGAGRFKFTDDCETLYRALQDAVYNNKITTKDERLDDGTNDIDTLDAFEYSFERDIHYLLGV